MSGIKANNSQGFFNHKSIKYHQMGIQFDSQLENSKKIVDS